MNNVPKISIIVPIYNIEKYISKCIDSILTQTYKDWELILVNDGSTDNSGKICDEYVLKDNRIKVIHKKNEGVTATRDRGVKEAKGEFLFFIDGDDYITENALELFINKQKENDADLVKGSYCTITNKNEIIDNFILPYNIKTIKEYFYTITLGYWNIWNTLYKTNIFKKHINIPYNITIGEDQLCNIQYLLGIENIKIIQDITYFYVQRSNSVVHTIYKKKVKEYRLYLLLLRELDKTHNHFIGKFKYVSDLKFIIAKFIILVLIYGKENMFNKHKKIIFKYYWKYYITKPYIQIKLLKSSYKLYLYSIITLFRFIVK